MTPTPRSAPPAQNRWAVTTAEKRAELLAAGEDWPACTCHDMPMTWHTSAQYREGGRWECRVGHKGTGLENVRLWHEAQRNDRRMLVVIANRHGCSACAAKGNLHRHHVDPTMKRFEIADATRSTGPKWADGKRRTVSFPLFYDELMRRTIALCGRCHRAEHQKQREDESC